ncbi:MAG: ABC transporter substrate-binding protein [Firmicutes bacterium]|nr:ABC transporter substrate-binding protein [Bacillota bacterium]
MSNQPERSRKSLRMRRGLAVAAAALLLFAPVSAFAATSAHAAKRSHRDTRVSDETITVYSAGPAGLAKKEDAAFTKATGIRVLLFQSDTGHIMARLQAERRNPRADVVVLASWSGARALQQQGMLKTFHPLNEDKLIFRNPASDYFAYSATALAMVYNTRLVSKPPRTWAAALQARWDNKIVIPNPADSGSAVDFVGGFLQNERAGWSYFTKLAAHGALLEGANAAALDQVLIGAKDFVLGAVDDVAYKDKAKGDPINIIYPRGGTVVNPRPVMVLRTAKNMAASERFVDFLLSKEGQQIVAKAYLLPGVRGIPASPKRASLAQIHQWRVNWIALAKHETAIIGHVESIFGG